MFRASAGGFSSSITFTESISGALKREVCESKRLIFRNSKAPYVVLVGPGVDSVFCIKILKKSPCSLWEVGPGRSSEAESRSSEAGSPPGLLPLGGGLGSTGSL